MAIPARPARSAGVPLWTHNREVQQDFARVRPAEASAVKDQTPSGVRNGNAHARNNLTLKACCPTTVKVSTHDLTSSGPAQPQRR
jgi:hypothetical protein